MAVQKAFVGDEGLLLECADTSSGECLTLSPDNVFVGHLSYVIDSIPPKDGTNDVTASREHFAIAWLGRKDLAGKDFDTARATDEAMRRIARKTGDYYSDNGYSEDLEMAEKKCQACEKGTVILSDLFS